MTKSSIGLGVLSIPTVFDTLGLIPGIICLIAVGTIITWSGYVVGVFKIRHPEVYGVDDAGYLMFGRWGREVFGAAFCLCKCIFRLPAYTYARSSKEYICLLELTIRLDLHRRLWNARHFNRLERSFSPRDMHSRLCGCCRGRGFPLRQHPNTRQNQLARLARRRLHHHLECVVS